MAGITASDPQSLLFALLALLLFTAFAIRGWRWPILDPDYWYLRWLGDRIWSGSYPHTNGWAWTAPDTPWVPLEPGVGALYALGGAAWAGLLRGLATTATAGLIAAIAWRPRCALATILAMGWADSLVIYGQTERALTWGNLLLAATVALLGLRPSALRLAAATAVVGVWANVHGSFIIGVFLVLAFDWRFGCAAAALTLANPEGWHLWATVFGYGASASATPLVHGSAVAEWFPPDIRDPRSLLRVALLLGGSAVAVWPKQWRAGCIIVPLLALGLRHQRCMEVAAIAALPWFASALERLLPARRMPMPFPLFGAVALALAVVMPAARFDPGRFPADFPFASLSAHRVWNDYEAGGFLGYHGVPVFWDSRADCYPADVLEDGLTIQTSDRDRLALLAKWRIDTVVTALPALRRELPGAGWIPAGSYGDWAIYQHPR